MQHDKPKKLTRPMIQQMVDLFFEKDTKNPVNTDVRLELFENRMAASLPEDFFGKRELPDHLSVLCDISGISKSETFKSVIKSDKAELGLLVKIKDYFKGLSGKSVDDVEYQIYISIYYAAIANAMLHRDEKISSHSYEELAASYTRLLKEDWLPNYIVQIYRNALTYCTEKQKK